MEEGLQHRLEPLLLWKQFVQERPLGALFVLIETVCTATLLTLLILHVHIFYRRPYFEQDPSIPSYRKLKLMLIEPLSPMVRLILFAMALQLGLAFVPIIPSSKISSARLAMASHRSHRAQPLVVGRALFFDQERGSPVRQVTRWLFRAFRHLVVALISIFPLRALALIVDRSVVEAAESARMAVRPGTLKDRIISGHIELITTALLEKQQAQYLAMRNMIVGLFIVGSVFGVLATISTSRAEKRLRDQEMEIFGEFRDGSTEMIEEDEDDDPQIDAAKPADPPGGGPADNQPKASPPNTPPAVKPPREPEGD